MLLIKLPPFLTNPIITRSSWDTIKNSPLCQSCWICILMGRLMAPSYKIIEERTRSLIAELRSAYIGMVNDSITHHQEHTRNTESQVPPYIYSDLSK